MCIRCDWSFGDWVSFIENSVENLAITDEEKKIMLEQIRFGNKRTKIPKTSNPRQFLSFWNDELGFDIPKQWKCNEQRAIGFFSTFSVNSLYNLELQSKIEEDIVMSVWSMPKDESRMCEDEPYDCYNFGYGVTKIHPHRKKLFLLANGNQDSSWDVESYCGHCHRLEMEYAKFGFAEDYKGLPFEFIDNPGRFDYGTAYYSTCAISHRSATRSDSASDAPGYYKNGYCCWRFFASKCYACGYQVAQIKSNKKPKNLTERIKHDFKEDVCLACYYFEKVLNELMEFTEFRYDDFNFLQHRKNVSRQWPLRKLNNSRKKSKK